MKSKVIRKESGARRLRNQKRKLDPKPLEGSKRADRGITNGHSFYVGVNETGLQKLIHALFIARPHYFHYATNSLGGGNKGVSLIAPIQLPFGVTIDFGVDVFEPEIDFAPPDSNSHFPPTLPITDGTFGVTTLLHVSVPKVRDFPTTGASRATSVDVLSADLTLWAVGRPSKPNSDSVGLQIDAVQVGGLGNFSEIASYILLLVLRGFLSHLSFSINGVAPEGFTLTIGDGPLISADELRIWAEM